MVRSLRPSLVASLLLLSCAAPASAVTNSLTITERAGVRTNNYPIQIGRPFVRSEIPNFPQALVNGTAVTTQADVKTRWPDGSVKHAILTFLIPTLSANASLTVTFRNQTTGNNSGYLTQARMLGGAFDFDAVMALTNGASLTASARSMLSANAFTYWLQGPVATSIVLADHGATRAFDIGFDNYRSFRPVIHATFWPGINKVRVRFIGEIASTEAFQDQVYSLALRIGVARPTQVYSKAQFTHTAGSRWTREFWIGGAPSEIAINHNLAYLASTTLLPNYDTAKVVPEGTLAYQYSLWTSAPKDIGDAGNWTKSMGTGGGRPDIGPITGWSVRWLYSGDARMQEMAFGNADLAAAWPMHLREGRPAKYFDAGKTILGVGKVVSVRDRPTMFLHPSHFNLDSTPGDMIQVVGSRTTNGWDTDYEHFPEPFFPHYLLSGDFWYLEEMYFWSSFIAGYENPGLRGPTGAEGSLTNDSTRAMAWTLRNRFYAATMAPDGSDEKAYFTSLIDDAISAWEGQLNLTGTRYTGNSLWKWGRTNVNFGARLDAAGGIPPLRFWDEGLTNYVQTSYGIDPTKVSYASGEFMDLYFLTELGIGKRLGYALGTLFTYFAPYFINQVVQPAIFNPHHIGQGRTPERDIGGAYFTTWAQVEAAYLPSFTQDGVRYFTTDTYWNLVQMPDAENGYSYLAMAALSTATEEPNGQAAWNWILANVANDPNNVLRANPKWCLVPAAPTPPFGISIRKHHP